MSDPYLGEIRAFGFNFAPSGWFPCDGRTLAISQYAALFAILGTNYGGNGSTTFQLPNLQGRVPMHWNGNSTTPSVLPVTQLGEAGGSPSVTLNVSNLPPHQHLLYQAVHGPNEARTSGPSTQGNSYFTQSKGGFVYPASATNANTTFSPKAIGLSGGGQPHDNMQPYLAVYFGICYMGAFPPHG
jgi:microcystin-dependent protein